MGSGTSQALGIIGAGASIVGGIMSARATTKNAQAEIEAMRRETDLATERRAIEARALASKQKVSFLTSGLMLEGTPMDVLSSTLSVGQQDVQQMQENYYARARSMAASARSQAISSLIGGFSGAAMSMSMASFGGGKTAAAPKPTATGSFPTPVLRPTTPTPSGGFF